MALLKCPDCDNDISSLATNCPNCGYPIAGGGTTQAHGGKVVTVELTGKKLKLYKLIGILVSFVGILIMMIGVIKDNVGALIIGIIIVTGAAIWLTVNKFLIWWHHK
jgi:xanthine/uracil/vitamin C permease (AzgA family)